MTKILTKWMPVGQPSRPGPASATRRHRHAARLAVLALGVTALAPIVSGTPAFAATGGQYLSQATDPHGNVWLAGTTDGTTTGPMDPGTDPAATGYGHVWTTDVPSGFCRILPGVTDPTTGAVTAPALDRSTVGGCIVAGGKAGTPTLDPRRNANGTFYVYTPDWAVKSAGVYRMTYDPGSQTMTKVELMAPNRYPSDNKPFGTALGPQDHQLYVSNDLNGSIARISGDNGPISAQTVETNVAKSSDGTRVRAITFVCWSNLAVLNGGAGAARTPGQPGCTAADPAPDLVLAQKNSLTVVLNAETCTATAAGCLSTRASVVPVPGAAPTPGPKVLTPMGLRTDPANPTVFYISDSPGTVSHIHRYNINTDVQDSYANFGVLNDGSLSQFAFAFSVGFDPQHAMYVGDDPSAGASAFNGRYFRVGPNAPADVTGAPGVPANDPSLPPQVPAALYGGVFGASTPPVGYSAPTLPGNGVWMGSHLWLPDTAAGMCRMDVPAGATLAFDNTSTCKIAATAAGMAKPEQSAFDASRNLLYVADGGSKSVGVVRFHFDPVTETLNTPEVIASGLVGSGLGLDGQRADAVALDPLTDALYVGFRTRKIGASTQIARVPAASGAAATQNVEFVAATTRDVPVFGLGVIVNPPAGGAPATSDLYIGDNKGVDLLTNVATCAPGACTSLLALNIRGPKGFATDGKDKIYLASPPPPGVGGSTTNVDVWSVSTGLVSTYASSGVNPDATQSPFAFAFSLTLDPAGNLYVGDNPSALAPPNGLGRVWKAGAAVAGPAQPSITGKVGNPTNHNNSSPALATTFTFASANSTLFRCSLTSTVAPDAYTACSSPFSPPVTTVLADGNWTFKVESLDATGAISIPAVYSFSVDTVAPVLTISAAPTSPTKANTPSFTFASSKAGTTFACSLSTGLDAFGPCGSPQTYPAQADGSYTFKVQGTDLAGNTGAVASGPLVIDTVAPVVTASPAGGAYASQQSVSLTTNEPASIVYTTDGSTPTAASTAYTGPITIAGSTVLTYLATDPAGNAATASQTYTIGSVSLDSKPSSPTANSNLPLAFSALGVTGPSFTCALTQAPAVPIFTPCTSPTTYPGTANGSYTFTVRGTDSTGAGVGSATTQVVLDASAPKLTSNPPNPANSSTETFAFTKAQAAGWTFQCSFVPSAAADAYGACTSPDSHANTADGTYSYKVKALDADGFATAIQPYTFAVTAGAAAPSPPTGLAASLVTPSGPITTTAVPVTLNWTSGSANSVGYELQQSLNGGTFLDLPGGSCLAATPCTVTTTTVTDRPSATNQSTVTGYRYQVRAQNSAGAWGPYSAVAGFSLPVTDNSAGFSFNGGWSGVNLAGAFNGSVQQSATTGAFATNSSPLFGTTVGWVSTTGPDRGMASVSIDGGAPQVIDLYSPSQQTAQVVWTATGLGSANGHTIRVSVLSTRNAASTGNKVDIDAYLGLK